MWRIGIAACALGMAAAADGFTFTIGSPVAAQDYQAKGAAFVFRTEGCAEPAASHIGGTAEGLVSGGRRSVPLKVIAMSRPGVYAVPQNWPGEGDWVVILNGTCAAASAGAIVPIGPRGFIRESSKFFRRPPTNPEIETALRTLSQGRNK
jgi:hypothetical protein